MFARRRRGSVRGSEALLAGASLTNSRLQLVRLPVVSRRLRGPERPTAQVIAAAVTYQARAPNASTCKV